MLRGPASFHLLLVVAVFANACPHSPPTPPAAVPAPARQPTAAPSTASAPASTASLATHEGVPRIDAAMKARLQAIHRRGLARGVRPSVFAKLGDSITESASFLHDVGHGWYELGPHAELRETIEYFHRPEVDAEGNDSFAHPSAAAVAGWTANDALDGAPAHAVARELDALRPSIALVMFGTNDIDRSTPEIFTRQLGRIVDECLARGVIPVLSTIPDRRDNPRAAARVPGYNARIVAIAREKQVPLMDLHAALAPLPQQGIDVDGVHPNIFHPASGGVSAGTFTPEALRYGYNVRNLLALRTLARLRAVVLEDGAPDA